MEFEGMSFDDAEANVRREVEGWKAALERREAVSLGHWGQLSTDEDCHWVFTQTADAAPLAHQAQHYGLTEFEMSGWQEPKAPALSTEQHTANAPLGEDETRTHIVLPFGRIFLQRVAMIVLILACCFVGFFMPSHRRSDSSLAGMVDSEILTGNRLPNVTFRHTWEEIWDEEVARLEEEQGVDTAFADSPTDSEAASTDLLASRETSENDATNMDATAASTDLAAPTADKMYYIIIGSCSDMDEANRQLHRLDQAGITDAGVLLKDNRYRICLRAYDDRTTAEKTLTEVRDVERFHDAWLLPARQATVKYISKIKYNEQLPMELSHLTTRTQRDQGGDHS
jgi:hypothetical protein